MSIYIYMPMHMHICMHYVHYLLISYPFGIGAFLGVLDHRPELEELLLVFLSLGAFFLRRGTVKCRGSCGFKLVENDILMYIDVCIYTYL